MGMIVGVLLAVYYRSEGPQRPKYQYEIEKELGIEPPDLEGMYLEQVRLAEEAEAKRKAEELENQNRLNSENEVKIIYHIRKENE
jgi:hypothetical protein